MCHFTFPYKTPFPVLVSKSYLIPGRMEKGKRGTDVSEETLMI